MSSANSMSCLALNALCEELLKIAARTEREKLAAERLTAAFGTPADVSTDFTFDFQPIGVGH